MLCLIAYVFLTVMKVSTDIFSFWANYTANWKHPYTTYTLANGQSVRDGYRRFEECKGALREILYIV